MWQDDQLIGLSEKEAERLLNLMGLYFMVARRGVEHYAMTMEWNPRRISVEIDNDHVVSVKRG